MIWEERPDVLDALACGPLHLGQVKRTHVKAAAALAGMVPVDPSVDGLIRLDVPRLIARVEALERQLQSGGKP